MLSDHAHTASPNAGWTMSAMAGLLGTVLEKPGHYSLGKSMREPKAEDIGTAIRVMECAAVPAAILALGVLAAGVGLAASGGGGGSSSTATTSTVGTN